MNNAGFLTSLMKQLHQAGTVRAVNDILISVRRNVFPFKSGKRPVRLRPEETTFDLKSRPDPVSGLLLEKKN